MEHFTIIKACKYCTEILELCTDEGLDCSDCKQSVHIRCLKRGTVPGGLNGDLFYTYICQECSSSQVEVFKRNKLSWLQIIILVLYHLQTKSPGLARKGFFHWRNHLASFIDRNWTILFSHDVKRKKKWTGTIAGTLSHFSSYVFLSGTSVFQEPAWWTLLYPKLTPFTISNIYYLLTLERQRAKLNNDKRMTSDSEMFQEVLRSCIKDEHLLQPFNLTAINLDPNESLHETRRINTKFKNTPVLKRKNILPTIESTSKKIMKLANESDDLNLASGDFVIADLQPKSKRPQVVTINKNKVEPTKPVETKYFDPFCHYNTSLSNLSRRNDEALKVKLLGGIRMELIYSPYSTNYLKPYIRRDIETFPAWLMLMAELQLSCNENNSQFVLPSRAPIDYTYVQPEHIPAINSLCNQFFWPGIDLTESLQYPDFSCVALYKKLIIGFAFLVPDVKHTENYISFLFTRPGWRNCGIARFMIYHLIQTSLGKDITLHVSINNPALFLYQKFGFKVEKIDLGFYDKYLRNDVQESKHAFFCRLER